METKQIVIERRSDDILAYLKENTSVWGCGDTQVEAIGDLVWAHKEMFEISDIVISGE